jgi:hypothetical protein
MVINCSHFDTSGVAAANASCSDSSKNSTSASPNQRNGMKIYRIQTAKLLANGKLALERPLSQMDVPLCSFGPGGEYVVDWYVHRYRPQQLEDQDDSAGEIYSPLKLLFREMRDVFLGIHPGRRYRSEARPDLLEPCPVCRQESQYSPWAGTMRPAAPPRAVAGDKSEMAVKFPQPVLATRWRMLAQKK